MGRIRHLAAGGASAAFLCSSAGRQSGVILAERLSGSSHQMDHVSKTHSHAQQSLLTALTLLDLFSEIAVLYKACSSGLWILLLFTLSYFLSKFKLLVFFRNYGSWAFKCY